MKFNSLFRRPVTNIPIVFTVPKNEAYGDYATNLAMTMAKVLKQSPMKIAESLVNHIPTGLSWLEKIEVVKPGFINFFLKDKALQDKLSVIIDPKKVFGQNQWGKGKRFR